MQFRAERVGKAQATPSCVALEAGLGHSLIFIFKLLYRDCLQSGESIRTKMAIIYKIMFRVCCKALKDQLLSVSPQFTARTSSFNTESHVVSGRCHYLLNVHIFANAISPIQLAFPPC